MIPLLQIPTPIDYVFLPKERRFYPLGQYHFVVHQFLYPPGLINQFLWYQLQKNSLLITIDQYQLRVTVQHEEITEHLINLLNHHCYFFRTIIIHGGYPMDKIHIPMLRSNLFIKMDRRHNLLRQKKLDTYFQDITYKM